MRRASLVIAAALAAVLAVVALAPAGKARSSGVSRPTGSPAAGADWAQFGFIPSHTDYNPFEKVLSPSNVARLRLARKYRTDVIGQPAVTGGVVYADYGSGVSAHDVSTGKPLWFWGVPGGYDDGTDASPAVVGGVVYIGAVNDTMFALDASTGQQLWSKDVGYDPSSAAVTGGVVYVGSDGVYAFRASNGHRLWDSFDAGGTPAVTDGVVYSGSGHRMYALRASNGHKLWSYPAGGSVQSPPAVTRGADGVVYFGSGHRMYALRASNGHKLWSYRTAASLGTLPAVARGVVYLSLGDRVIALRASNGRKLWSSRTGTSRLSPPAVANGVVYVGSGRLYALRASNGKQLWSSGGVGGSPVVANGVVYATSGRYLKAFALKAAP